MISGNQEIVKTRLFWQTKKLNHRCRATLLAFLLTDEFFSKLIFSAILQDDFVIKETSESVIKETSENKMISGRQETKQDNF